MQGTGLQGALSVSEEVGEVDYSRDRHLNKITAGDSKTGNRRRRRCRRTITKKDTNTKKCTNEKGVDKNLSSTGNAVEKRKKAKRRKTRHRKGKSTRDCRTY